MFETAKKIFNVGLDDKKEVYSTHTKAELVVSPNGQRRIIATEIGDFANHNGSMIFEVQSRSINWWTTFLNIHLVDRDQTSDAGIILNLLNPQADRRTGLHHSPSYAYWHSNNGQQTPAGYDLNISQNSYRTLTANQFPCQTMIIPPYRIKVQETITNIFETIVQAIKNPPVLNQAVFDPQTLTFAPAPFPTESKNIFSSLRK